MDVSSTPTTDEEKIAQGWVKINKTNFPDENFRNFVLTERAGDRFVSGPKIDYNNDEWLSPAEIEAVEWIDCSGQAIGNLKGIGYFKALEYLNCSWNHLTKLEVGNNTALTKLFCGSNQLTELDVSKNTGLITLFCYSNQLAKLDINTALTTLDCHDNQLTKLDISNNTALEYLHCNSNHLTELDVSKNKALEILFCHNNQLTELDVGNHTALKELLCRENQLTKLDVGNNTALWFLDCQDNQLTKLNVGSNTALLSLYCSSNPLTVLDVSQNKALAGLICSNNQLTELDVSKNTTLSSLYCDSNQLKKLDVSKNTGLITLYCNSNQLTELNVSKNTKLIYLKCDYNQLTSLDLKETKINDNYSTLPCNENCYNIKVDSENRFDLQELPGHFDVSMASNWKNGRVDVIEGRNILTVAEGADKVTYTYDCGTTKAGKQFFAEFTLNVTGHNANPVDPDIPEDGGDTDNTGGDTDDAADNIKGALSAVVVGAVAGAIIYETGTGIYRVINMPGIAMPSNRGELAMLLWEHAGKPEPVSTALYSDIDEGGIDLNKAARWAVEQGLMQDNSEKNTFNPHFPVSKLRTCLTWNAAKEKGLFDTDKTAE